MGERLYCRITVRAADVPLWQAKHNWPREEADGSDVALVDEEKKWGVSGDDCVPGSPMVGYAQGDYGHWAMVWDGERFLEAPTDGDGDLSVACNAEGGLAESALADVRAFLALRTEVQRMIRGEIPAKGTLPAPPPPPPVYRWGEENYDTLEEARKAIEAYLAEELSHRQLGELELGEDRGSVWRIAVRAHLVVPKATA
jgi:hypothetical protein